MKIWIINIAFLIYAFYDIPIEITDNFLAYLIPFIISIISVSFLILNFRFITGLNGKFKKITKFLNWITLIIFCLMTLWNIPIQVTRGYGNKNWTDISMFIDPKDSTIQYIRQHIEYGGSDMPGQSVKVKKINSWLRWRHHTELNKLNGKWLFIDNSREGYNRPPFELDETKIDFDKDKHKAKLVTLKNGRILDNAR